MLIKDTSVSLHVNRSFKKQHDMESLNVTFFEHIGIMLLMGMCEFI